MPHNDSPKISRLTVYPVKSLPGVDLTDATILPSGALENDRRWAMIDGQGKFVNGKRTPRIAELAATFDLLHEAITVGRRGDAVRTTFSLTYEREALTEWLSVFFGQPIRLVENTAVGHPDDLESSGPTIVSTETLAEVASWFDWPLDSTRQRFRANIELEAPCPFWEDRLFGANGTLVRFRMGDTEWLGSNPCARCVVPSRHPLTGEESSGFAARFADLRERTLPPWAEHSRFDHFYRLAVNTRPMTRGGRLAVGNSVELL